MASSLRPPPGSRSLPPERPSVRPTTLPSARPSARPSQRPNGHASDAPNGHASQRPNGHASPSPLTRGRESATPMPATSSVFPRAPRASQRPPSLHSGLAIADDPIVYEGTEGAF